MLRQIRYFQAAARCGNLEAAAAECLVNPAFMDKQIRELERSLSAGLLERKGRSCSLTAAGENFYLLSLELAPELDRLVVSTVHIAHREKRQLFLGCLRGYNGWEFQRAMKRFGEKHPETSLRVTQGSQGELYEELLSGRIDLMFCGNEEAFQKSFSGRELASMQYFVELPANDPLAWKVGVEAGRLRELTCIAAAPPLMRQNIRDLYHDVVGIHSEIIFADSIEEACRMTSGGAGYMLSYSGNKNTAAPGLSRIFLLRDGKPFSISYSVFWQKDDKSQLVQAFRSSLRSIFAPAYRSA